MTDFTPFVNVPYAEADCWQLTRMVLEAHGITPPAYTYGADRASRRAALRRARPDWVRVDRAQPLDVAMFTTPEGLHVGVIVARGKFLHADRELGRSRVERLSHPEWAAQLEGIYRYAG